MVNLSVGGQTYYEYLQTIALATLHNQFLAHLSLVAYSKGPSRKGTKGTRCDHFTNKKDMMS